MDHLVDWSFAGPGYPVWLSDADEAFIEATIVSIEGNQVEVKTKGGKKVIVITDDARRTPSRSRQRHSAPPLRLLPRAAHSAEGVENMDDLNPLNEATIIANIETRFRMDLIYTRTGPILIAMNPFKRLPIYQDEIIAMYNGRRHGTLPPHCYQEAEDAYQLLGRDGINQSVIICGESGAGKTETTKKMLKYISTVARPKNSESTRLSILSRTESVGTLGGLTLGERMVDSNALTEAFGNAKTVRNNNSSRFGKFTLFSFSKKMTIKGGRIKTFLLEKSRITSQPLNERNYHVFYQLLAGAPSDWQNDFHLGPPESFYYMNMSGCMEVPDIDDSEAFDYTCDAMDKIQIGVNGQKGIFQVVAGVLHLGQIEFTPSSDGESCEVLNAEEKNSSAEIASKLLGLDKNQLAEALTTRVRVMPPNQEFVTSPQTAEQSRDSRDALSKAVYSRLFDHLVVQTNNAFDVNNDDDSAFIGILDIFGFEDLVTNSFEQVFINYTNEKLQSIFNDATFRKEVEEYAKEKIPFDRHDFPNNQPCLDLIEKKPMGLLHLLDSECLRGAVASDQSLLNKLHRAHSNHPNYLVCGPASGLRHSNGRLTNASEFIIKHYAGLVIYETTGFIDKNKDALFDHLFDVASQSSFELVASLFPSKTPLLSSPRSSSQHRDPVPAKAVGQTVATRFTTSLNELTDILNHTQSRFVRCVKTNNLLKPQIFDKMSVLRQLKTSGVMAALEIRRAGYPTRILYSDFVKQFKVFDEKRGQEPNLSGSQGANSGRDRAITARMMTHPKVKQIVRPEQYRFGATKVFFQADILMALYTLKDRILFPFAVKIQRWWLRKQEHIFEHLLTRTMHTITAAFDKAKIHGVQNNQIVYDALNEAIAHIRNAKNLNTSEVDVFRPALDRAVESANKAREEVDKAAAIKQHETEQRAHHLRDLDTGRLRINRIKEESISLTVSTSKLEECIKKASSAIETCQEELLKAANSNDVNMLPPLDVSGLLISFGGLPGGGSTHHSRAQGVSIGSLAEITSFNIEEFPKDPELMRQMKICKQALRLVEEAEKAFNQCVEEQNYLEGARDRGKQALDNALKTAESAMKLASLVGIEENAAVIAAKKNVDSMHTEALVALDGNSDNAFSQAVDVVQESAERLMQVVEREKEQKEEDDRREEGRLILRKASALQTHLFDQAIVINAQNRKGMIEAIGVYDSKLEIARAAEAGSSASFIAAATAVLESAEAIDVALQKERQHKEACNRIRQVELARLELPLVSLANLEASCVDLGIIRETAVNKAIAKARSMLDAARNEIEESEDFDPAELTKSVTNAISYTPKAERVCAEAKQKREAAEREMAIAGLELNKLEERLSKLRTNLVEHPDAGLSLLSTCDEVINAAATEISKGRRLLRQCSSLKEMHLLIKAALLKVEEAEKSGKLGQLRATALLRRRSSTLSKLKLAEESLGFARSSLSGILLENESQAQVQKALEEAESALRTAQHLAFQPVSPEMLQSDSGDSEEGTATDLAAKKIEAAEAIAAQVVANAERLNREWNLNNAMLSNSTEKHIELKGLALISGVSSDEKVMIAMEKVDTAAAKAKLSTVGGLAALRDPHESRRLIDLFSASLTALDAAVTSAQRDKEELDKQYQAAKEQLEKTCTAFSDICSKAYSSGPVASSLCRTILDEVSEAIQSIQKVMNHFSEDKNSSRTLAETVAAAMAKAVQKLEAADQFTHKVIERCNQAKNRRTAAMLKMDQAFARFALAEEKMQKLSIDYSGSESAKEMYATVKRGQEILNIARELSDNEQVSETVESILDNVADFENATNAAVVAVTIADECIDAIISKLQRSGAVIAQLKSELENLTARHDKLSSMASADGNKLSSNALPKNDESIFILNEHFYHTPKFVEAVKAVETCIEDAHNSIVSIDKLELSPAQVNAAVTSLKKLRETVREEEVISLEEKQKSSRRQTLARRAQSELMPLKKKLEDVKSLSSSLHHCNQGSCSEEIGKAVAAVEALERFAVVGHHMSESECVSVDSVSSQLGVAEASVKRLQGRMQRAESARIAAMMRFDMCQAHFNEIAVAAANFNTQIENSPFQSIMKANIEDIENWKNAVVDLKIEQPESINSKDWNNFSPSQLVSKAFLCSETAISAARQLSTADISVWIEEGGLEAAKATEKAEVLISAVNSLVLKETHKLHAFNQKRLSIQENLHYCSEKVTSIYVAAELQNVLASDRVSNPLYQAESVIASSKEELEKGNIHEVSNSIKEIQRCINEAESAMAVEIRRKENLLAAREQAKKNLEDALCKLNTSQSSYSASGYAVSEGLDKLTENARNLLSSALKSISEGESQIAPVSAVITSSLVSLPNVVGTALKAAEEAESALSLDYTTRREAMKREKLRQAAERIKARRESEEERAVKEEALRKRRQLKDNIDKLDNRLSSALPSFDELAFFIENASSAVFKAKSTVSTEHMTDEELAAATAAYRNARDQVNDIESILRSVEVSQSAMTDEKMPDSISKSISNITSNQNPAYMGEMASAFEDLTVNVQTLMHGMTQMQQFVQHQSRIMHLQSQLISGVGDRESLIRDLSLMNAAGPNIASRADVLAAQSREQSERQEPAKKRESTAMNGF